jgi:S-sulfo-L-cysteine synthase (O-acetyl-L-serine-dependent)
MTWRELPCYGRIPDPEFEIEIEDFVVPVIRLPETLLPRRLRGQSIRIHALLGFIAPPGNIKRIPAGYMVRKAIETGLVRRGGTLVEPTSGNMGVSLAFCARPHGIKVAAIVSDTLPRGKVLPLQRMGAQVVKESEAVAVLGLQQSPGSIELARRYAEKIGGVLLNQYGNDWNPGSWEHLVAPGLWRGAGGEVALFASAVGSTGTLLGLGRYFRARDPTLAIMATIPYLGQEIDGTRDRERLGAITHDWMSLHPIVEPIDEITARALSAMLNEHGIPAGPSSGAVFGSTYHWLLNKLAAGQLDAIRDGEGRIKAIVPFADTSYPYERA